jgi:hypothetical protein
MAYFPHFESNCSFCNASNHDIRFCNNYLIELIEKQAKNKFTEVMSNYNNINININNINNLFITYLFENLTFKQIRALAVRIGSISPFRNSKRTYAEFISDIYLECYFSETYEQMEPNYNAIQTQETEQIETVTWYEDLVPNYLLLDFINATASENTSTTITTNAIITTIPKYDIVTLFSKCNENKKIEECSICYENIKPNKMVKLNCNHHFCSSCIIRILKTNINNPICKCALCRNKITTFETSKISIYDKLLRYCL